MATNPSDEPAAPGPHVEDGLVRTAEDALTVLRQASEPLGPMGAEWLQRQKRDP